MTNQKPPDSPEEFPDPKKVPETNPVPAPEAPAMPEEEPLPIPSEDPLPEIPNEMPSVPPEIATP